MTPVQRLVDQALASRAGGLILPPGQFEGVLLLPPVRDFEIIGHRLGTTLGEVRRFSDWPPFWHQGWDRLASGGTSKEYIAVWDGRTAKDGTGREYMVGVRLGAPRLSVQDVGARRVIPASWWSQGLALRRLTVGAAAFGYVDGLTLDNVTFTGRAGAFEALQLAACVRVDGSWLTFGGGGYGVRVQGCRRVRLHHLRGATAKHLLDIDGGSEDVAVHDVESDGCEQIVMVGHGLGERGCRVDRITTTRGVAISNNWHSGGGSGLSVSDVEARYIQVSGCESFRVERARVRAMSFLQSLGRPVASGVVQDCVFTGDGGNPLLYADHPVGDVVFQRCRFEATPEGARWAFSLTGRVRFVACEFVGCAAPSWARIE